GADVKGLTVCVAYADQALADILLDSLRDLQLEHLRFLHGLPSAVGSFRLLIERDGVNTHRKRGKRNAQVSRCLSLFCFPDAAPFGQILHCRLPAHRLRNRPMSSIISAGMSARTGRPSRLALS